EAVAMRGIAAHHIQLEGLAPGCRRRSREVADRRVTGIVPAVGVLDDGDAEAHAFSRHVLLSHQKNGTLSQRGSLATGRLVVKLHGGLDAWSQVEGLHRPELIHVDSLAARYGVGLRLVADSVERLDRLAAHQVREDRVRPVVVDVLQYQAADRMGP